MATIIRTNGTQETLEKWDLRELQGAVGGYIEGVHLEDGRLMYVNEDGLMKKLPVNEKASEFFPKAELPILGDVVLLTAEEALKESSPE